jgi:hypothetical protein
MEGNGPSSSSGPLRSSVIAYDEDDDGGLRTSITPGSVLSANPTPSLLSYSAAMFEPQRMSAEAPSWLPQYTAQYHRAATRAYNTMLQLPRKLNTPWMAFVTGMVYVHHFMLWQLEKAKLDRTSPQQQQQGTTSSSGSDGAVDPVLLACAAFSLASKVENYGQVRVAKIIKAVFHLTESERAPDAPVPTYTATGEVMPFPQSYSAGPPAAGGLGTGVGGSTVASPLTFAGGASPFPLASAPTPVGGTASPFPSQPELSPPPPVAGAVPPNVEYGIRKEQVLKAEMMILYALGFDVVKKLPFDRILTVVQYLYPAADDAATAGGTRLLEVSRKLLSYSLMTPLCCRLDSDQIADGLVAMVARATGEWEELNARMLCRGDGWRVGQADQEGLEATMYACLILSGKKTGLPTVDNLARLHQQRARGLP